MEAAPRLPMISFELKMSTEPVSFGHKLKQYISAFYHEDPESYGNEIHNLETLRSAAVRPALDVSGCQTLKRYYCQLNFLKSRFPMEKGQPAAVTFSWKDLYAGTVCSVPDIDFELMSVLYNVGALHSQLGAADSRASSDGMKLSCTHFQCAAWAFQHLRESQPQLVSMSLALEVVHFMYQLCLAQAQECILEKSMMDNRKSIIIAKVAVQVVDYYAQAVSTLCSGGGEEGGEVVGVRLFKDWTRYLKFKVAYHSCVVLLYQGQQAEEQQKMGERVSFYQAASEQLDEARRLSKNCCAWLPAAGGRQHEVDEALTFTQDVVEGKRKAARNENEFIYHEAVPERDALHQLNGASLVRAVPFSVDDEDVAGPDIFGRLVPMEAHEASSVYSEQKAEMLRRMGATVEARDRELAEFMGSLQLDGIVLDARQLHQQQQPAVPQDVVDRAAALSAKPQATQHLVDAMSRLAGTYHEVESLLAEVTEALRREERLEREYASETRPPSMLVTDLTREAAKYAEAHSKANESNQALHRAMTTHISNLKVLCQPLGMIEAHIPCLRLPDPQVDERLLAEMHQLLAKVEEMRSQRQQLVAQLREAVCSDDITALLVTSRTRTSLTLDQLFERELAKHRRQAALIEQNLAAQENVLKALTAAYARFSGTRRYMADVAKRREQTVAALVASYDAYDDLLSKANKGIEFYQKLETNVTKLLQRARGTCRVHEEEREQIAMARNGAGGGRPGVDADAPAAAAPSPKLKDYLKDYQQGVRPSPLGSEETSTVKPDHYHHHQQQPAPPPYLSQQRFAPQPGYQSGSVPAYINTVGALSSGAYGYARALAHQVPMPSYHSAGPRYQVPASGYHDPVAGHQVPTPSHHVIAAGYQVPAPPLHDPVSAHRGPSSGFQAYRPHAAPYVMPNYATPVGVGPVYQRQPYATPPERAPPSYESYRQPFQGVVQPAPSSTAPSPSNVDLLAGLDFTVNQLPLDPMRVPAVVRPETVPSTPLPPAAPARQPVPRAASPTERPPAVVPDSGRSFLLDVDRLEKVVDGLSSRTLNGPTPLDIKWKEIQVQQEREAAGISISVARCYPMRNRCPDVLPYDHSRVEIAASADDYINASHVTGLSDRCPPVIVTQLPTVATTGDLWTMVLERQLEVIVCLLGDHELAEHGPPYWPTGGAAAAAAASITCGGHCIALQATTVRDHWTERVVCVDQQHVVVHLQFTSWPGPTSFPQSPGPLVEFVAEVLSHHRQQRVRTRPLLVHCLAGAGRSGLLCLLLAAVSETDQPAKRLIDIPATVVRMSRHRKNPLRDREHLRFAYAAVLHHAREVAGVRRSPAAGTQPRSTPPPPSDPFNELDPLWNAANQ